MIPPPFAGRGPTMRQSTFQSQVKALLTDGRRMTNPLAVRAPAGADTGLLIHPSLVLGGSQACQHGSRRPPHHEVRCTKQSTRLIAPTRALAPLVSFRTVSQRARCHKATLVARTYERVFRWLRSLVAVGVARGGGTQTRCANEGGGRHESAVRNKTLLPIQVRLVGRVFPDCCREPRRIRCGYRVDHVRPGTSARFGAKGHGAALLPVDARGLPRLPGHGLPQLP
jgi:hypothetical protein